MMKFLQSQKMDRYDLIKFLQESDGDLVCIEVTEKSCGLAVYENEYDCRIIGFGNLTETEIE